MSLAQEVTNDPNAVTVALIGTAGIVCVALITSLPAWFARRASRDLAEKVGEPNGRGNVIEILHKLLDGQARQDERLATHDQRIAILESKSIDTAVAIGEIRGAVQVQGRGVGDAPNS